MQKTALALLVCLLFASPLPALDGASVLKASDAKTSFKDGDYSAEYEIVKRDPGGATSKNVSAIFRRDRTDQFLILVLEPLVDKGKGYLKIGETLWLYDPVGRAFSFTNAKERFERTSARIEDFKSPSFSSDYRVVSESKAKLGKFDCVVLDLEARKDTLAFPKVKLWISDDMLVRKREDYSLSGQLMRTVAIPTYQQVGDRWAPASITIVDHLKSAKIGGKVEYERTSIAVTRPSRKKLPDAVYTKEYLERVAK